MARMEVARGNRSVHILLSLLFLLTTQVLSSFGQTCQPYVVTGKSKCDEFLVNRMVYIPANATQQAIQDQVIAPKTRSFGAFVPRTCRSTGIQLVCLASLPPCVIINATTLDVLYPCRDLCTTMVQTCNSSFWSIGKESQLPNCILPDVNCVNITSLTAPVYKQIDCPYPLQLDQDANQATVADPSTLCVYPCPDPSWTDAELNGGWVMTYVIGFISFLLGVFMIFTWIISPLKRRYPANILLWLAIACTGVDAGVIWPIFWGGIPEVVCTDSNPPRLVRMEYATGHDTGCIMQAIVLLYFALATNMWWLGICIHLFEVLVLDLNQKYVRWFYRLYHIIAWGFPAIAVIVGLSAQQMAGSGSYSYCFLADVQSSEAEYNSYIYTLYFMPSFVCISLGSTLVFITLIKLSKHRFKLGKQSSISFWLLIRLLAAIVAVWWLFLWLFIYAIYGSVEHPKLIDAINDQVRCSIITGTDCSISEKANYGIWWLNLFNIASVGGLVFACLGTTKETFLFWWRLGKACVSTREAKQWWLNVKEELTLPPESAKRQSNRSIKMQSSKSTSSREKKDNDTERGTDPSTTTSNESSADESSDYAL